MPASSALPRPLRWPLAGAVALLGLATILGPGATAGAAAPRLRVEATRPGSGATGVGGTAAIDIALSAVLAADSPLPTITPRVMGSWSVAGRLLTFTPTGAYPPDGTVTVSMPGGATGLIARTGALLRRTRSLSFHVEDGSVLRAEQLLAQLHYLPVAWHARRSAPSGRAAFERAVFDPPAGHFSPIGQMPTQLRALWRPGAASAIYHSALGAFQRAAGLPATGALSASTWQALLSAGRRPGRDASRTGFTYAVANKRLPETLTIWQGGKVVLNSLANTGISQSPTQDGTFTVYERLRAQVMTGTSPWGSTYSDPVSYVEYFNGSDAVHFIGRSSYGYPQSFGCVELPLSAAEQAWNDLALGTLVTVTG